LTDGPKDCTGAGRYTFSVGGARVSFNLIEDTCQPRRMILDRSQWLPRGVQPALEARRIVRAGGTANSALPPPARGTGHWPSFRGPEAAGIAERQNLPDDWTGHRHEHLVAHDDSWTGTLQPDRLGRRALRDKRHQQPARRHVQARPLRRRRRLGRPIGPSLDAIRARQAHGTDPLGANSGPGRTT
jgi:hypothetical protein